MDGLAAAPRLCLDGLAAVPRLCLDGLAAAPRLCLDGLAAAPRLCLDGLAAAPRPSQRRKLLQRDGLAALVLNLPFVTVSEEVHIFSFYGIWRFPHEPDEASLEDWLNAFSVNTDFP